MNYVSSNSRQNYPLLGLTAGLIAIVVAACLMSTAREQTTTKPDVTRSIPFGESNSVALRYKLAPNVITTYVLINYDYSDSPTYYIEHRWPHFGQVSSVEFVGDTVNGSARVYKVVVVKYDCWNHTSV